jgi:hypothetical protein
MNQRTTNDDLLRDVIAAAVLVVIMLGAWLFTVRT